ncbi:MAG: hypothetical protein AAF497_00395, partial [Planctomycetota bacterium]
MSKKLTSNSRKGWNAMKRSNKPVKKLTTEALEPRRLLVTGPELIAVIPNSGDVLLNGDVLNVAPQQLTLVFNEGQIIDEATLDAIQFTRSGGDDVFTPAEATSDLGTLGDVVMKFTAKAEGVSGEGIVVEFTRRDFGGVGGPLIDVIGETITVELNSNAIVPTTAADVVTALNGNLASSRLLTASIESGSAATQLGALSSIPTIQLDGANTARATTDMNTGGLAQIEFLAKTAGPAGNDIQVSFDHQDLGANIPPFVVVNGSNIEVTLNARVGSETTAEELVLAVNNNTDASQLITARLTVGDLDADVTTPSVGIAPLDLTGANDEQILPGYIGVDPDRPNQVIVRFAEALPDDSYAIDILGIGDPVLRNNVGEAFNCAQDFRIEFELDLGGKVLAIVPQPVVRDASGNLSQSANVIDVFFNDDDLDPTLAENPDFYQLIKTQDTVTNTDDEVFLPTSVVYDADSDSARLTFGDDSTTLPGGTGTYRLRIGTDEATPEVPLLRDAATQTTTDLNTGGAVQVRIETFDSGSTTEVEIQAADFGGPADPVITVDGFSVLITVNSNPGNETTADELVNAINSDPFAIQVVLATLMDGDGATNIGSTLVDSPVDFKLAGAGATFETASNLGTLTTQSQIVSSAIDAQLFALDVPGGNNDPGHRDITFEQHVGAADSTAGITTYTYNFQTIYGSAGGNNLINVITETQKQRVREAFDVLGKESGIQFIEVDETVLAEVLDSGLPSITVAVGDLRAVGGASGLGGTVWQYSPASNTLVLDNAELWDDAFGALNATTSFYRETLEGLLAAFGLGPAFDLPDGTIKADPNPVQEAIFPGDNDILHMQHRFRPEAKDIDLFRFDLDEPGRVTLEVIAERQLVSSSLDSVITLYQEIPGGAKIVVSQNDDYFSEDSYLDLDLEAGTYFVGVTASGNNTFDPHVQDSGFGGTTQGEYDLRINFRPKTDRSIKDSTGVDLDGDNDGTPGGVHDYWFRSGDTFFVDKSAAAGGDGSLTTPFNSIQSALTGRQPGEIVRIVGNGGADGDISTTDDNLAYEVGFNTSLNNLPLADGTTMEIPQDVSVMIDAGSIFKLRRARIGVGSSAPTIDRSAGTLQVLGTPDANVIFTSYDDQSIGVDTNPISTTARPGDWGGISFRNDLDLAEDRFDYESVGVFMNYVNFADIRYGGGEVVVNSLEQIVTPIQLTRSRPTLTNNTITLSADAAISTDPNSFEETNFHAVDSRGIDYQETPFTSDYDRVGPEIHGNRLLNNTINGLFVRITTPAGGDLRELTVSGRWDDTDIVHVVTENLVIRGFAGGAEILPNAQDLETTARTDASLVIDPSTIVKLDGARIEASFGATLIAEGDPGQQVIFTSLRDSRFGAGGTFATSPRDAQEGPRSGDWGGVYVSQTAAAYIDNAQFNFGGGVTKIEGSFSAFNTIEVHQGFARIANSRFERNADGVGGQTPSDTSARAGRGNNDEAVIFVRGAQPVIVNNTFVENEVRTDDNGGTSNPAISIDVNSLNYEYVIDQGRARGFSDMLDDVEDNQGPLVRGNQMTNQTVGTGRILGMVVRGGTLNTESVWDDTDITHVLFDEVIVRDFHTYGGLHLESAVDESLVVKLSGVDAGFTATGDAREIRDRIGGRVQIVGQPGFPVVLTSLQDDTVGAGTTPDGTPLVDTNSDFISTAAAPGDWRSVLLEQFSHDRNVETINESERVDDPAPGPNGSTQTAQSLGRLAAREVDSDDNRRLGFEIHGYLTGHRDVDVYTFEGEGGTEVRFDIDKTSQWLDTVVELVDADGQV